MDGRPAVSFDMDGQVIHIWSTKTMHRMLSRALVLSAAATGLFAAQTAEACHGCGQPAVACVPMVPQTVTTYCNVTETVFDRVEHTVMKTQFRTEYVEVQVPITRCVIEEVPVTKMVTRVHKVTEMVPKPVKRCGHHGHCGSTCVQMVPVTRCIPEKVPVTTTVKRKVPVTETVTRLKPVRVPEQVPVTVTRCVPRQVVKQVPVTKTVMVPAVYHAPATAAPQAAPTAQSPSPQG
jgi:hypothetical protein